MMRFNLNFCQSFHSDFVLDATLAKSFSLAPQRAKGIPIRRRVRASERALLFRSSKTLKRQNYKEALISVGGNERLIYSVEYEEKRNLIVRISLKP